MNKTIENIKNGNYSVVDKQGVSVTEHFVNCLEQEFADLEAKLAESEKKIEELKGERLKFYTDDVRRTQVINGVHFDIEQLLVFSEYVEHEKWVISNRDKEIEELKQQLAEKEKKLNDWKDGTIICKWNDAENKVKDLEHQLAEKEKEIENLTLAHFESETNKPVLTTTQIINQDKIDFAVEQLEKVKEYADIDFRENCYINAVELDKFIDNQINELKKELE